MPPTHTTIPRMLTGDKVSSSQYTVETVRIITSCKRWEEEDFKYSCEQRVKYSAYREQRVKHSTHCEQEINMRSFFPFFCMSSVECLFLH